MPGFHARQTEKLAFEQDRRTHVQRHRLVFPDPLYCRSFFALAGAQRHAREGFMSAGVAMLKEVGGDSTRIEQAQQDLGLQRAKADTALDRAESAIKNADWGAAGHHLALARRLRPFDKRADALISRLSDQVATQARDAIVRGRVDTAAALLCAAGPVAGERLEVIDGDELAVEQHGSNIACRFTENQGRTRRSTPVLSRILLAISSIENSVVSTFGIP